MKNLIKWVSLLAVAVALWNCNARKSDGPRRLELLFLGHESKHHDSEMLAGMLSREYFTDGINITYTTDPDDLLKEEFTLYDGLIVYANHDSITPQQEEALLHFVASGKGFIPIHSASYCFRNSPEIVALMGGQFKSHGGGSFSAEILRPEHPALKGVEEFTTEWDETYVHSHLADDIHVLMERVDSVGREPYTWVKEYGKGRVFYTAFGHDERTFRNPGFLKLVKSGILWAVGEEALKKTEGLTIAQPQYKEARMPNYEKRDPAPMYQLPLSPEESQTLIQVPVGFRLELFASEPDIRKPIAMDWDHKGRLWVIETVDYPNTVRDDQGVGDDRILICEDTDGDGKADKFTTFADQLNIPTSFTFANGGVVVAQAPHFLFLKDTNGDDKADVREVIIDGWGIQDTHAGPSNLRYGLDNKIWGTVGYSAFEGQVNGTDHKFGQGVYRFEPGGKSLEYLGSTSNNTWGLGFSEEFDTFLSTANNEHSDHFAIPQHYYEKAQLRERGIEKLDAHYNLHTLTKDLRQVDVHGGFTAAAGHNLYTARAFPKEYWNRVAFICEPTGRLLHKHILEPSGSGFREKGDGWNMVASSDNWFGPVEAKVGPDGALWIADWYNFIIQHNPTPDGFDNGKGNAYIDPLRDNARGRIYRLVYEKGRPSASYRLDPGKTSSLLKAYKSDNMFWRTTAQRLLVESSDKNAAKGLYRLIENNTADELNTNAAALHAVWTLHGLGLLEGSDKKSLDVVIAALGHKAPGVRRAALQTLPVQNPEVVKAVLSSDVLNDADLRVRLAAFLMLADAGASAQIGKVIFEAVQKAENSGDKWISHALLIAGNVHRKGFMEAYHHTSGHPDLSNTHGSLAERIFAGHQMEVVPLAARGGILGRRQLPDFTGKELSFVADVKKARFKPMEGIIISYGDHKNGLAVWVKDQELYYQVNQKGKKTILNCAVPDSPDFTLKASLLTGGGMKLSVDGKETAKGKTTALMPDLPEAYVRLGHNRKPWWLRNEAATPNVGNYPEEFTFTGEINNARLIAVNLTQETEGAGVTADESVTIKAVIGEMKYDISRFTVKAGKTLKIIFQNPDHMQHNLLVIKPGTLEKVGAAADELARRPNAADMGYIPNSPDVLFSTSLVNPGQTVELVIKVPTTPGEYPFVCTFPGHWRIMHGIMRVEL